MTALGKPVTRESAVLDRGRPLVVTLHPRFLEIRPKGLRRSYSISYDACLWVAVKRELADRRREQAEAKQQKQAARKRRR